MAALDGRASPLRTGRWKSRVRRSPARRHGRFNRSEPPDSRTSLGHGRHPAARVVRWKRVGVGVPAGVGSLRIHQAAAVARRRKDFRSAAANSGALLTKKTSEEYFNWRFNNKPRTMPCGKKLRLLLMETAMVHWSFDDWQSTQDSNSNDSGSNLPRRSADRNSPPRAPDRFHVLLGRRRRMGGPGLPGNGRVATEAGALAALLNSPYSRIPFEAPCALLACLLWSYS